MQGHRADVPGTRRDRQIPRAIRRMHMIHLHYIKHVSINNVTQPVSFYSDIAIIYGTSHYGHLTSKKTSPLQSSWFSPKLYSTVQITPCNRVTSPLRSLLPSPVGDLNSEVPLYRINIVITISVCNIWHSYLRYK